jgi:hypothetical protein
MELADQSYIPKPMVESHHVIRESPIQLGIIKTDHAGLVVD